MMPRSTPNINSDGIPDRRLRDYSMTLVDSGAQCARYDQAKGSTPIVGLFGCRAKFTSGQTPNRRAYGKGDELAPPHSAAAICSASRSALNSNKARR